MNRPELVSTTGSHIKRLLTVLVAAALISPASTVAGSSYHVNGGGRGTLDGATAFSQFGFGVSISSGGSAQGHFTCLMAGSSAFPDFEPLMKVSGKVTSGSANLAAGTAEFSGSGTLNLGPSGRMAAVFHVAVTAGGAGDGTMRLTVLTPDFPLPTEAVMHGNITIH